MLLPLWGRKGVFFVVVLPVYVDIPFMFHALSFAFLLIAAKDNCGKCRPCLRVAHEESEKERQNKYSTLLFALVPAPPPGPRKLGLCL